MADRTEQDRAALLRHVEALEQEVERLRVQSSKCKWCGVPHERGMNTLCPFTVAERKLARLVEGLNGIRPHHKTWNPSTERAGGWNDCRELVREIVAEATGEGK